MINGPDINNITDLPRARDDEHTRGRYRSFQFGTEQYWPYLPFRSGLLFARKNLQKNLYVWAGVCLAFIAFRIISK